MAAEVYGRLGEVLRRRRDAIGLSQASLADRVGLGRTSITNIEKGVQSVLLHQFLEIAEAIGASPEELLEEAGVRPAAAVERERSDVADLLVRLDRRGLGR